MDAHLLCWSLSLSMARPYVPDPFILSCSQMGRMFGSISVSATFFFPLIYILFGPRLLPWKKSWEESLFLSMAGEIYNSKGPVARLGLTVTYVTWDFCSCNRKFGRVVSWSIAFEWSKNWGVRNQRIRMKISD